MTPLVNLLVFVALLLTLLLVWRQSRPARLRLFVAQSAVLALLALTIGLFAGRRGLVAVAAVFLLVKVWIIPRVLARIAAQLPVRPVTPGRSAGLAVLGAGALVVLAYVIMLPVVGAADPARRLPTTGAIPLAFAITLIGLALCVTGRDALGQILGFLALENGIFALALLATWGLPGLVEAGVFLDVLVVVLIMEGVVVELRREHDSLDVDRLRELRG
jgi:hydrogenase-4 component E